MTVYAQYGDSATGVSVETNNTGTFSPILRYRPDGGTLAVFLNKVTTGDRLGIPLFADFRKADGSKLPNDASFRFVVDEAGSRQPVVVSEVIDNIGAWQRLELTEQQNTETIDAIKVKFEQPNGDELVKSITVRDVDEFRVELESSTQIDPSKSALIFDKDAIDTRRK